MWFANKDNNIITGTPTIIDAQKDMVILLDAGHAKNTPGKRQKLKDDSYFFEYLFNRQIVKKIANKLSILGIRYEIITPEDNYDVPLSTRVSRANNYCNKYGKDNCFLISVHSNAYGDGITFTNSKGWSVYTTKGKTKSDEYATIMWNKANQILPRYGFTLRKDITDGDPDYEENFTVIYKTKCPAVLTENLFFTNEKEVTFLMSEEGQNAIADIHVEAIKEIVRL